MKKISILLVFVLVFVFSFSMVGFAAPKAIQENKTIKTAETVEIDTATAAPGVAAQILQFNGVKPRYGEGKTGGNFIADVAKMMGPKTQFSGINKGDANLAYQQAVLNFLNHHAKMTKTLVMPTMISYGHVVAEDFGVMTQSGVIGYTVGFGFKNATAADVSQIVIKLYKGTTVLGTITSNGVLAHYPTATSLSAPFDVKGTFNYVADGNWAYSGWLANTSVIPTKAEIKVTFKNGMVDTAVNTTLTGDTSIFTKGNVVAEDFGVMNVSNVIGYTVGFHLVDTIASDVHHIVIKLYNGGQVLGTITSTGVLTNYPTAIQLSAPFDVKGTFNYASDGNWSYSGWMGQTWMIPNKAEITVTFKNGLVKTAINTTLTGDTSIF